MNQATATTPNTSPPVTAAIIPNTIRTMFKGSSKRPERETTRSPTTMAPTPERATAGLRNFSAMLSLPRMPRLLKNRGG